MYKLVLLLSGLIAVGLGKQTPVAGGYHIAHPETATATPAAPSTATTKKAAAKQKKHLKSVVPGK